MVPKGPRPHFIKEGQTNVSQFELDCELALLDLQVINATKLKDGNDKVNTFLKLVEDLKPLAKLLSDNQSSGKLSGSPKLWTDGLKHLSYEKIGINIHNALRMARQNAV